MSSSPRFSWALALLFAVTVAGCPGPTFVVQQYGGPVRAQDTIATLRINASESAHLVTLDGEDVRVPLEVDSRLHIELLPGKHRLGVANGATEAVQDVLLTAEAGKVYRVVFVDAAPHVFEVNRSSDAAGADVTPAPVAPAPVAPAPVAPAPVAPVAPAPEP